MEEGDVRKNKRVHKYSLEYALVIREIFALQGQMSQKKFPIAASMFLIGAIEEMLRQGLFSGKESAVIRKAITIEKCMMVIPSSPQVSTFLDRAHILDEFVYYR